MVSNSVYLKIGKFFRAGQKVKIWNFIGWFCLKDKFLGQNTDTAVYCPHTEGRGGSSLTYLYSSRGKERGVRGIILTAFCCFENIWKLKTQKPQAICKWNLPDICTTSTPHISEKIRASMIERSRGCIQKFTKKSLEIYKMLTLKSPKSSSKNTIKAGVFSTVILNHLTVALI